MDHVVWAATSRRERPSTHARRPLGRSATATPSQGPRRACTAKVRGDPNSVREPTRVSARPPGERRSNTERPRATVATANPRPDQRASGSTARARGAQALGSGRVGRVARLCDAQLDPPLERGPRSASYPSQSRRRSRRPPSNRPSSSRSRPRRLRPSRPSSSRSSSRRSRRRPRGAPRRPDPLRPAPRRAVLGRVGPGSPRPSGAPRRRRQSPPRARPARARGRHGDGRSVTESIAEGLLRNGRAPRAPSRRPAVASHAGEDAQQGHRARARPLAEHGHPEGHGHERCDVRDHRGPPRPHLVHQPDEEHEAAAVQKRPSTTTDTSASGGGSRVGGVSAPSGVSASAATTGSRRWWRGDRGPTAAP